MHYTKFLGKRPKIENKIVNAWCLRNGFAKCDPATEFINEPVSTCDIWLEILPVMEKWEANALILNMVAWIFKRIWTVLIIFKLRNWNIMRKSAYEAEILEFCKTITHNFNIIPVY